jgi:hypothetical protein
MPRHVIRLAKRRTAWELANVDELITVEFTSRHGGVDLRPSVYVFDAEPAERHARVVQLRAEHAVSLMEAPNTAGPHIDLEGVAPRDPVASPGATRCSYANAVHHDIPLVDRAELEAMLYAAKPGMLARIIEVTRDEVLAYVGARQAADDPEWTALLRDKPKWSDWVRKHRAAKAQAQ